MVLHHAQTAGYVIIPIKYKIRILDLMLLSKNSVPLEGLYYSKKAYLTESHRCLKD